MSINDWYIILTASVVSASCAILGCFLVLRKMAMVGDAISHAVLPGIVIAFLISGSRDSLIMVAGASAIGLLTTFIIEFLHRRGRLQSDAAIGVTFTSLFAAGVILVSAFTGKIDLDQDCVLYGEIAYVPLDLFITDGGTIVGPRALIIGVVVLLFISGFVWIGFRPLALTTFDPAYAGTIGVSAALWHYLLMGSVSVTTVASFESVGAILVVALLIGPATTSYLLTDNLKIMILLSVLTGIIASAGGYFLAVRMDGSIAGAIASVNGVLFLLAMLFSPRHGLITKKIGRKISAPVQSE